MSTPHPPPGRARALTRPQSLLRARLASPLTLTLIALSAAAACSGGAASAPLDEATSEADGALTSAGTTTATPIGLALDIEDGAGVPIKVRAGQTFYINQLDLRAAIGADTDEGVAGLDASGDFAPLPWSGVALEEESFSLIPNPDGTFTRSRFYRGAVWMRAPSVFTVAQIDDTGRLTAPPIVVHAGMDDRKLPTDDFAIRRLRAIQWTYDCPSYGDCAGATTFAEEALIELRNATDKKPTFSIKPSTTALRLGWSMMPGRAYVVPIEQVASPPYDYGVSVDVDPLTPPEPGGYYTPGQDITFKVTLRDGSGNRLHPEGSLPSYNDALFGPNEAGIRYYEGFFDPNIPYWRRQHRERMMMAEIIGPVQDAQPIRTILPLESMLTQDIQEVGLPARDGVYSAYKVFPATNYLFLGFLDPQHTAWSLPASDTFTFHLPDDAEPGTYRVAVKVRRVYNGEDIPFTRTISMQVGTPSPTTPSLGTGKCNTCHTGSRSLANLLHANADRATCAGCHVPLSIEHEVPIPVRVHFIHSRSNRVGADVGACSLCHLSSESIQRTSKSACLSCHRDYPQSHVAAFGPIQSIFVGGGTESFDQCSTTCHTTHPGSGL